MCRCSCRGCAGNLVFWWLLLIYAHLTGSRIGGPWAGRLAVALIACEPNLVALATIGGSDVAIAACLLMLLYHFRFFRERTWPLRIGVPILCYGLCLMTKASGLMFGAICMTVSEIDRLYLHREAFQQTLTWPTFQTDARRFVGDALQIGFGGLMFTLILCGCDWQPEPSFVAWRISCRKDRRGRSWCGYPIISAFLATALRRSCGR